MYDRLARTQWVSICVHAFAVVKSQLVLDARLSLMQVSAIVRDGKEQARYNSEAAKLMYSAGSSYARTFPEAPFLKPTFQELKALATAQPGKVPPGLASRPWPDVFLIYRATGGG